MSRSKNLLKEAKKLVNPKEMGNIIGEVMKDSSSMTPEFMEKVTTNQVFMQENQVEFEKYLKDILANQKKILKLLDNK